MELEVLRKLAKKSLYFCAKFVLNYNWLSQDIHKPLCDILQDFENNRRVRVLLPRGWLKSTVCSIAYPIWRAINDPNVRILLVQNTDTNARSKLRSIRGQWEKNPLLRSLFPELLPGKKSQWTTESLCLTRTAIVNESTFEAAGRGTQLTGRHYNVIVEDDTVAPDKDEWTESNVLPTKDDIEQALGFHRGCIPTLSEALKDQIVVVGTRWFQQDLLSWVKEKEPYYKSYERAVRETDGLPDLHGEIAWPERFPEELLKELETGMGPYLFSCLYLNNPLRDEDMVFQHAWFRYYETIARPTNMEVFITIDPAGNPKNSVAKGKKKNDYNVVMVMGRTPMDGLCYVLDYVAFKGGPGELVDYLFDFVRAYRKTLVKVGVEAIAYQESLEYIFTERMKKDRLFFNLELIKHSGSQESSKKKWRITALQPLVRSGTLLFRSWMTALVSQLQVFPLGVNDDLADALAMFLQLLQVTVVDNRIEETKNEDLGFGVDAAVRALAHKHRPPAGSVFDVFHRVQEGATDPDPYAHLFEERAPEEPVEGLSSEPSVN